VLKKTSENQKRVKGSSRLGDQTSEQEKAMAKPLKKSKKFRPQSLGLSITQKTSSSKVVNLRGWRRCRPGSSACIGSACFLCL
jgi:hypothetical protein